MEDAVLDTALIDNTPHAEEMEITNVNDLVHEEAMRGLQAITTIASDIASHAADASDKAPAEEEEDEENHASFWENLDFQTPPAEANNSVLKANLLLQMAESASKEADELRAQCAQVWDLQIATQPKRKQLLITSFTSTPPSSGAKASQSLGETQWRTWPDAPGMRKSGATDGSFKKARHNAPGEETEE